MEFTKEEVAVIKEVVATKIKEKADTVIAEKAKAVRDEYEAKRKAIFDKAEKEATDLQVAYGEKLK